MIDLLVFTDLDGTLLDHHDYSCAEAMPALQRLASADIPLIFNTSKTSAEVEKLQQELKNRHPFIIENGSAVCIPHDYFPGDDTRPPRTLPGFSPHIFGPTYRDIVTTLDRLRQGHGFNFLGFSDMEPAEVTKLTGLDANSATLAKQRSASEPLLWEDTPEALDAFRSELDALGLALTRGGRFYHVMGQTDKATAMHWLLERYQRAWPQRKWSTVALGDSENDRAMLEAADLAVIIPPASGDPLRLSRQTGVIAPREAGPRGWQQAMHTILNNKGV